MSFLHPRRGSASSGRVESGNSAVTRGRRLGATALTAAVVGGVVTTGLVALGAAPASAYSGGGQASIASFQGWVLPGSNRELGIGKLADGTWGPCLDAGGQYAWPSGTTKAVLKTNPKAALALDWYTSKAVASDNYAAALWIYIGDNLGLNSQQSYMHQSEADFKAAYPSAYADVMADVAEIAKAVNDYAPPSDGYSIPTGFSIQLDSGSSTTGTVDHPGVRSDAGNWVPGAAITLTLSGDATWLPAAQQPSDVTISADGKTMTFNPDKSDNAALTASGNVKQYLWQSADGADITASNPVKVTEKVSGLADSQYKVQPSINGSQRVGFSADEVSLKNVATAFGDTQTQLVPLSVDKLTDGTDPGDQAGMIGATVTVHQDSPTGPIPDPVQAVHTFTAADITGSGASAHAHWDFPTIFDPDHNWWVVLSTEPEGFTPAAGSYAKLSHAANGDDSDNTQPLVASFTDYKVWTPVLSTQVNAQEANAGDTLVDHVKVSNTGGYAITGDWQLLGPVTPAKDGTCDNLNWTGAKVAGSGTFTANGDGTYNVGSTKAPATGCYTYVEKSEADDYVGPTTWTTPGQSTETSSVLSTPVLHTQAQAQVVTAGHSLVDNVTVTGTQGVTIPGQWQLLGPIQAKNNGSCNGLNWSKAPVAATGTFTANGDGTTKVTTGTVKTAGCYVFEEKVAKTHSTKPTNWTTPVTSETVTVKPKKAHVPAHPQIDTGFNGTTAARAARQFVSLPGAKFKSALLGESFHGSTLFAPNDTREGGIWTGGADLSAVAGTTVAYGHVSNAHDVPGAFGRLNHVRKGQIVTTYSGGHKQRWRIVSVTSVDRHKLPRSIFTQKIQRKLVLVTCTGEVHYASSGHFHYTRNRIVTAIPVR